MSKIERGVKRRCGSCEAPFYDMMRHPIACPKCGAVYDSAAGKKRLASVPRPPKARNPKSPFGSGAKPAPAAMPKDAEAEEPAADTADDSADADLDAVEDGDEADGDAPGGDDGDDDVTGDR